MVTSSADFEEAYLEIRKRYEEQGLKAGKLERIGFRYKWNYVLTDGDEAGVAFNFTGDHAVYGPVKDMEPFIRLKPYIGESLFAFIEALLPRTEIQMRSLCLAALNALSRPLLEQSCLEARGISPAESETYDFIRPDDIVTIVGFGGLYRNIYDKCRELHITDMRPKHMLQTLTVDDRVRYGPPKLIFHTAEENERILSMSDVVFMTGCTLVNGTFEELIRFASPKARVIGMYGPSAALLPDFLIGRGINWISSSKVLGDLMRRPQFEYALDLSGPFQSLMRPYFIRAGRRGSTRLQQEKEKGVYSL